MPCVEKEHQKSEKSKYRFVILTLVWLISFVTSFQYVEYVNLPQSVLEYFEISHTEISWTITIMNAVFLTLVFAVIALLEKISLRNGIILCTSFIFIGSIFKCLGMFTRIGVTGGNILPECHSANAEWRSANAEWRSARRFFYRCYLIFIIAGAFDLT